MRINIILPTSKLAGAEKRFIFMFMSLVKKKHDIYLFITKELYEEALKSTEFEGIIGFKNNIILTPFKNGFISRFIFINYFLKTYPNAINHFVLWFPLRVFYGKVKTLFTFPSNEFEKFFPYYKRVLIIYFFRKAQKVDFLDSNVYHHIQKKLKSIKQNFSLTPNSCVNTDFFYYDNDFSKNNNVVFLGRFDDQKQCVRYLDQIPDIQNYLIKKNIVVNKYYLIGFGEKYLEMEKTLEEQRFKNLSVEILQTTNPELILRKAKVFLSLQKFNNYPSRALMEAMASGNLPIVTDVGTTKLLANESFAEFVPKDFEAIDIAKALENIFNLSNEEFYKKAQLSRAVILKNFTLEKMENYYLDIYQSFT